ncbi:MAG: ATP-binding protein [Bacteroidales bacterium]|nr:ATP-binding protein [Bacteroidales bacterium]
MGAFDIRQLIGETTEYDKKVALEVRKPKSWCKSVSAFANGIGGKLVWGIADDGSLIGLDDPNGDAEKISEAIKAHIDPIPDFNLSFAKCEDKEFVVLDVMPGTSTPYYYIGDGQMQAFVRIGNESVVASVSKHKELVLKGSHMSYDSLPSRWNFKDMAFTVLRASYFTRTNRAFEDSDFESFGIINEKGELTNAGALLADYSPVRHSRLFCTRWNGTDKANGVMDALDDEEHSGSLVTLLQAGLNFVRRNSKKAWRKTADTRLEYPEYPERAVEEGLVNALIHRNYLELGSEVHIDMYDDRLEIYSPGGLLDGCSIDNIDVTNIASRRRNPVLADIFSRLKYMERRGSGFRKIISAYKEHNGYSDGMDPKFSSEWDSFVLVLPKFAVEGIEDVHFSNSDTIDTPNAKGGQKGGQKTIDIILQLIKDDPTITREAISKSIGISASAIQKHINRLKANNIIVRRGGDRGGYWEVLQD